MIFFNVFKQVPIFFTNLKHFLVTCHIVAHASFKTHIIGQTELNMHICVALWPMQASRPTHGRTSLLFEIQVSSLFVPDLMYLFILSI
jgi:hypothetical protein